MKSPSTALFPWSERYELDKIYICIYVLSLVFLMLFAFYYDKKKFFLV